MSYLGEWRAILPVWLAAAAGWLCTQILPLGLKVLGDYRMRFRRTELSTRRAALIEEWDLSN